MPELSPAPPSSAPGQVVYANPSAEADAGGIQLIELWRAIRRRQRLVLVVGTTVFVACTVLTAVSYTHLTLPTKRIV